MYMSGEQKVKATRVLESVVGPGEIVKFIDEIVRYAPNDMKFTYFSWPNALFSRYDVFHVHWPEFLVRHKSPVRAYLLRFLFTCLILRLKLTRTPVVRTVHNVEPHHVGAPYENKLLSRFSRLTTTQVVMSDCAPKDPYSRRVTIPHGDFKEVFQDLPRSSKLEGRVLLFGRIQPYKGVIELMRAAAAIDVPGVHIRIVGEPTDEMRAQIEQELALLGPRAQGISFDLRRISDAELVAEVTAAELVVLPYRDAGNGNSGVAMVALSLGKPVLMPSSCVAEDLASEIGSKWVHLMESEVTAAQIQFALEQVAGISPEDAPNFSGRDWKSVAESYARVFRTDAERRNRSDH